MEDRLFRPEFEAALRLFARVSSAMIDRGLAAPVLVGGGAVELYTASAISTGDLDLVTPWQEEFEAVLRDFGFSKPGGTGHTQLGWVHPTLRLGFEVVSSSLYDGMADRERVMMFDLGADGSAAIVSIEDMIADRMGQYASGTAPEMLVQAQSLFDIHKRADLAYMDKRIRYETGGDFGVADLQA